MSATVTHLLFGAITGLGMRVRLRYLPLIMVLATLPDLDHLDFLEALGFGARVTFHNVFFCVFLPLAIALLFFFWKRPSYETKLVALAAVPAMSSHLLLDMYPYLYPVTGPTLADKVGLFYPLSEGFYYASPAEPLIHPEGIIYHGSSFALILFTLILGLTLLLASLLAIKEGRKKELFGFRQFAKKNVWLSLLIVTVLALASLFPLLAAAQVVQPYHYPQQADLVIESAVVDADGNATLVITHNGGDIFDKKALTLYIVDAVNKTKQKEYNPMIMKKGVSWEVSLPNVSTNMSAPDRAILKFKTTSYVYDEKAIELG